MFAKLKNKIAEEVKQSPLKLSASVQQLAQAVVSPSSSSIVEPTSNDHFSIGDETEETPKNSPLKIEGFQSVNLHGEALLSTPVPSAGGRSRHSSTSSVTSDSSSLFPTFEPSVLNSHSLQSDLESASEVEDSLGYQLDRISKEQLYAAYRKVQTRYTKCKGRYADLVRHYRELDRENVKAKTILVESQDKALRRIAELKEQCQLEQKAKAHLEDALRNDLEEKDHLISTLYTKIELLKLNGGKEEPDPNNQKVNSSENLLIDLSEGEPSILVPMKHPQEDPALINETNLVLKEKVWKLETLLSKCKESIRRNKERISHLSLENQQLLKTVVDTKASSSAQLSALTQDLTAAQQEVGKLVEELDTLHKREEDAALSLAENKMAIHRELEAKEEQIKSLRDSLAQITHDKEALLERATSLQKEMTELKSVAVGPAAEGVGNSEEDRHNLMQELSRGKAQAVKLLQQEMQQKLINLETEMSDKLHSLELINLGLEAEIQTLKQQVEEQDQANKELKLKSIQNERSSAWKVHSNSEENSELEEVMKELENKLLAAETKLAEKENVIAEFEANSKLIADEHNKELMFLKSKVELEAADRLQAESKLSERDQEIKELNDMHEQQLQEGQKVLAEVQTQLHVELSKKSEAEKKYIDLINKMGNMDVTLKNRDAELNNLSSEIASLKGKVHNLELKLNEAVEDCTKASKEKENLGSCLVGSLKAVAQLKLSLQTLRTDVYCSLNYIKQEVGGIGSEVMDVFNLAKKEVETVSKALQEKVNIHSKLKDNLSVLEKQLSEQEVNIKSGRNLEGMLEDLKLSKKNLETEVSENNALIKKLQHELQNVMKTLEKKEQETSELHDYVTDLQKELTLKTKKANEDLAKLASDYKIELESKDIKISELKKKHDKYNNKITRLQGDVNIAESKLKKISDNYKNLKLEKNKLDEKVKELEEQCESLKLEVTVVINDKMMLSGTVDELTSVLTGHKEENYALNEKIERLTDSLSDSSNEVTGLRIQIEKLSNGLKKVNDEKQSLEGQIEDIQETKLKVVENMKFQEEAWKNKSESDKVKITKLEMDFQSLLKELKNEKQQFQLVTSQLEQSQQREIELSAEAAVLKEELIKAMEDLSDLKFRLEQTDQREQLLSAQMENISKGNTSQGQLLKEKQEQLEIMAAEMETILSRSNIESNQILETEAKLITLNKEKEKWLEEQLLLETKEKDIKQLNIKLEEQLNMELQRVKLLEEECRSVKESNDLLAKQFEQQNAVVDSLRKKNKENYELSEQLKTEKTALENIINSDVTQEKEFTDQIQSLQSELINLKSENETLSSEKELVTQQLEELKKELQESICEGRVAKEIKLNLEKILMEKSHLEKQFENLMQEKQILVQQLNDEENSRKGKQEEQKIQIEKLYVENKDLQEKLDSALKQKLDLEQTLTATTENMGKLQVEMAEQERCCLVIDELTKQLKDTLQEKANLEHRLSAKIENARGVHDLEKMLVEKEDQLGKTLMDIQTKEKQFAELEDIHAQKMKQLAHDFEKQLVEKDELFNLEERREQEENLQVREYWDPSKKLHEMSEAQGEAFQHVHVQHEGGIKVKDTKLCDCGHRIEELQAAHQQELVEVDNKWHMCLEQQLTEAEARYKEELTELSKEWQWERKTHVSNTETAQSKELENTSQLAVAAVESGTGSIELLHRQLVAQTSELKEVKRLHRLEVNELRHLLSLRRTSDSSKRMSVHSTLEDACTELEYLRNILYEYMMGKEPMVLARVIAAVVKFDTEQTSRVLQKEEQKQTLLGQLGVL